MKRSELKRSVSLPRNRKPPSHVHYWLICEKHILVTYTRCRCCPTGFESVRVPCRCNTTSQIPPGGYP